MTTKIRSQVARCGRFASGLARSIWIVGVVLHFAPIARAQVYAYFTGDPTLQPNYSDYKTYVRGNANVSGITVVIPWGPYDNGTGLAPPVLDAAALATTLDPHLSDAANGKTINLIVAAATGGIGAGGVNTASPAYVFTTAWASRCVGCTGSTQPVDTCDCSNYQGSNYANLKSNCANTNNALFDQKGVPAAWELPFYAAYEAWLGQFIGYYSNTSVLKNQIGYIRIGVGTGGGSVIPCPNVEAGNFAGFGSQPAQTLFPNVALTEAVWKTYNNSIYSAVAGDSPNMILEASMYGGEAIGSGNGSTPIAWADDVAGVAINNGLGIGAESLSAATDNGDLTLYSQGNNCSNDWCALFNQYSLAAPMLGLQTVNISNPACLNQPSSCNLTGSLVTALPFGTQRHAKVFEIGYPDLICAYSPNGPTEYPSTCPSSTVTSPPYTPYQTALAGAAADQPNNTASFKGKASVARSAAVQ